MSVLLHIDTAVQGASLCISVHEDIVAFSQNEHTKEGAGWIHPAIDQLIKKAGITFQQLEAISISAGPGSYTGLRVGMAAAKGLCYGLNIPIISISTLKMMGAAAPQNHSALLCPMIDARRMEVFTALYDKDLNEIIAPHNLILTDDSFATYLKDHQIHFLEMEAKNLLRCSYIRMQGLSMWTQMQQTWYRWLINFLWKKISVTWPTLNPSMVKSFIHLHLQFK